MLIFPEFRGLLQGPGYFGPELEVKIKNPGWQSFSPHGSRERIRRPAVGAGGTAVVPDEPKTRSGGALTSRHRLYASLYMPK